MSTIETTYQAGRTAVGTVVRLATGRVADRVATGWTITGIYSPGPVPRGLYDTDLPATVLHDPTQPAPAGVHDREAIARAAWTSYDGEQSWDELCALAEQKPDGDYADIRDGYLGEADRILTILPGRTVAQVKAEALREFRATVADLRRVPGGSHGPSVKGAAGSERREAVERFVAWILSADFEITHAEVVDELEREDKR